MPPGKLLEGTYSLACLALCLRGLCSFSKGLLSSPCTVASGEIAKERREGGASDCPPSTWESTHSLSDRDLGTSFSLSEQSRITSTLGIDGAAPWFLLTSLLLEKWTILLDHWMLPSFPAKGTAMRGLLPSCWALAPLPAGGHFSAPKRVTAAALVALCMSFERENCSSTVAPGLSCAVPLPAASSVTITLGVPITSGGILWLCVVSCSVSEKYVLISAAPWWVLL